MKPAIQSAQYASWMETSLIKTTYIGFGGKISYLQVRYQRFEPLGFRALVFPLGLKNFRVIVPIYQNNNNNNNMTSDAYYTSYNFMVDYFYF